MLAQVARASNVVKPSSLAELSSCRPTPNSGAGTSVHIRSWHGLAAQGGRGGEEWVADNRGIPLPTAFVSIVTSAEHQGQRCRRRLDQGTARRPFPGRGVQHPRWPPSCGRDPARFPCAGWSVGTRRRLGLAGRRSILTGLAPPGFGRPSPRCVIFSAGHGTFRLLSMRSVVLND